MSTSNENSKEPIHKVSSNNDINRKTQPLKVNSSKNNQNCLSPSSVSPPSYNNGNNHYNNEPIKRKPSYNGNYTNGNGNGHGHDYYQNNNENCFTQVNVETIKEDFDFEQNLALFDKDAFYEEVEGQPKPTLSNSNDEPLNAYDSLIKQLNSTNNLNGSIDLSRPPPQQQQQLQQSFSIPSNPTQRYQQISVANLFSSASTKPASTPNNSTNNLILPPTSSYNNLNQSLNTTKNYRYDEMILDTGEPMDLQQIQIPLMSTKTSKRYVTDDGVILPCLDNDLRKRLFDQSYKHGFSKERQIECMGRCCAEMALQLVGGPLRFSPKNNHQKPSILVLANSQDLQGSYALCTARLLSIRSCKIYIYTPKVSTNENNEYFQTELNLFRSIDAPSDTFLNSVDDVKNLNSIDLIINGIDASNLQSGHIWYKNLVKYIENCKASVLSIDPNSEGSAIQSKWCVIPVLPLEMSARCGRVYLCDLGFTKNMFQSVNIKYKSPFGAKFLIPLHND